TEGGGLGNKVTWCVEVFENGFFFFSSRRRHTRFDCDWSSDVCSSDLQVERIDGRFGPEQFFIPLITIELKEAAGSIGAIGIAHRSEERRVGKECRSRWWASH